MSSNLRAAFWGAVVASLSLASAWAETPSEPAPEAKPMAITSRSMTVKNLDQRVLFDQDVTISKGDMDLSADRVEVVLARPADSGVGVDPLHAVGPTLLSEDNIERIEANGRVKVVQGKKTATADHAVYHRAQETIVLTGHPETWEEGVKIQGSKITILLKEQRSVVEESRVVIYPETTGGRVAVPGESHTSNGG
jgi:lipopolysaccharide export system protein LptA